MLRVQEELIRNIRQTAKRVSSALARDIEYAATLNFPSGASFSGAPNIPDQPYSVWEVLLEAQHAAKAVLSIPASKAGLSTMTACTSLSTALKSTEATEKTVAQQLETFRNNREKFHVRAGLQIVNASNNEEIVNLGPTGVTLYQNLEALKTAIHRFAVYPKAVTSHENAELESIAGHAASVAELLRKAQSSHAELVRIQKEGTSTLESINDIGQDAEIIKTRNDTALAELISAAQVAKNEIEDKLRSATSSTEQIGTKQQRISDLVGEGEESYQTLKSFSEELDKTREKIEALATRANEGADAQERYINDVRELIETAESMVSGATVAGLAKAFADERDALDQRMKSSLFWFGVGIVLLFLATLLLAAYVLELPISFLGIDFAQRGSTNARGDEVTVAGVLSRAIILLAPFWLTLFSARRYRSLFDLRQQYTHKYSMAFSMQGFKQQAPKHSEDIAAWVFQIVSASPIQQKGGRSMDEAPSTSLPEIVDATMDRFAKIFRQAKASE